ncbi:hypothetical protein MMC30_000585 [Trapelia coarctata]|nr:hypothetical protein [Trapelia coarctata]
MASSPPQPRRQLPQPESTTRATRRFAVEPVETSLKSNRSKPIKDSPSNNSPIPRRFVPQLEESSIKSNRRGIPSKKDQTKPESKSQQAQSAVPSPQVNQAPAAQPRRFAPQLIETSKRSRRRGDVAPALLPTDKTDLSPGDKIHLPRHLRHPPPNNLPDAPGSTATCTDTLLHPQSRFSSSALSRKAPRQTSYVVPHLPSIRSPTESEESNDSDCPSLSTSPSAASEAPEQYKHASRVRESCDDRFSGYLLELAARAAEKQLRNQAMAAYPNEKYHEHVDHFAVGRDSDSSDEEIGVGMLPRDPAAEKQLFQRESAAGWEMDEMRRHKETLEHERKRQELIDSASRWKTPETGSLRSISTTPRGHEPASDGFRGFPRITGHEREVLGMRSAASPPMLGGDLKFPMCPSPKATKFDATQRPSSKHESGIKSRQHSGLWTPVGGASRQGSGGGLWHGVCTASENEEQSKRQFLQTGLMTPYPEHEEPSTYLSMGNPHQLPASPPDSGEFVIAAIDNVLSIEETIEAEFDDGFVTQIYNYLSLGYPSLARKYDEELSKISKVSIEEIRRSDHRANTKGYLGTPEGCCDERGAKEDRFGRWEALKLYIKEWARQQPGMVERDEGADSSWGVRARRGSWAI